jgi:hypothetical protein
MPIGATHYSQQVLPPSHADALDAAVDVLVDEWFDDVARVLRGAAFAETSMASYLPPKHLPRYTSLFAKQFLTCLLVVAWKLRSPARHRLACVGEELALRALIEAAHGLLELQGEAPDFGAFEDCAFEDFDIDLLFDPAVDGVEAGELAQRLALANLSFEDWFKPFREGDPVHPYVATAD